MLKNPSLSDDMIGRDMHVQTRRRECDAIVVGSGITGGWAAKEHPYSFDSDKKFHWIRGYHHGGRSLTWARQCYRWSDLDSDRVRRDPKASVLNAWNQCHDVSNVFVTDDACMTSSACQNPSVTDMTLMARACHCAVAELKRGNI